MAEVTVAILGLGRIGASVGLALKRYMKGKKPAHTFTLVGHDERAYNSKKAKEIGAVDSTERNPRSAVANAHIVFLATPYNEVELLYETIGPDLMPGAVVLDASPLKMPSLDWAKRYVPQEPEVAAYMVGFTPVLNPQLLFDSALDINDADHARVDLFDGGTMLLLPASDCPSEAVDLATEFTRIIGATVHYMDPAEHDGLVAGTEGLPVLLSAALFKTLRDGDAWDDMRRVTNPTFALAIHNLVHQHPDSALGLLHRNRANTARYLGELVALLEGLRASLEEDEDGLELEALLGDAAQGYEKWEGQRFGNRWEKGVAAPQPTTGVMGSLGTAVLGGRFGRRGGNSDDEE